MSMARSPNKGPCFRGPFRPLPRTISVGAPPERPWRPSGYGGQPSPSAGKTTSPYLRPKKDITGKLTSQAHCVAEPHDELSPRRRHLESTVGRLIFGGQGEEDDDEDEDPPSDAAAASESESSPKATRQLRHLKTNFANVVIRQEEERPMDAASSDEEAAGILPGGERCNQKVARGVRTYPNAYVYKSTIGNVISGQEKVPIRNNRRTYVWVASRTDAGSPVFNGCAGKPTAGLVARAMSVPGKRRFENNVFQSQVCMDQGAETSPILFARPMRRLASPPGSPTRNMASARIGSETPPAGMVGTPSAQSNSNSNSASARSTGRSCSHAPPMQRTRTQCNILQQTPGRWQLQDSKWIFVHD